MNAHVILTGATGFLGSALARALVARGRVVHALARASSQRSVLDGQPVQWREADVTDAAALARAFADSRAEAGDAPLDAVHCAALVSYRTRDADEARAVNVEGTRNALEAAQRCGVRRFLHVSSVVTLGPGRPGELLSEESPRSAPPPVDYVVTKRAAEELALAACDRLDVVVVNPAAIFGAGSGHTNGGRFLRRIRRRGILAGPPGTVAVVGVEDAAEGCVLALERGRRGRIYLLAESNLSLFELLALSAREAGVRAPLARVPPWLWSRLVELLGLVDRALPLERITPQSTLMLGRHFACDGARARTELGWKPRPFDAAIRAALAELAREERGGDSAVRRGG